jgi:hypothetical protein
MLCDSPDLLEKGVWWLSFYTLASKRLESIPTAVSVVHVNMYPVLA